MSDKVLKVLSAGAVKTAVSRCAQAFTDHTGVAVDVDFATAPVLRKTITGGKADVAVVIAPVTALQLFDDGGHTIVGSGSVIGSVKAAVTVKVGAREPDLSSVESLKQALLDADELIYNVASSGQKIATMIDALGVAEQLAAKTTRSKTGAGVMEHLHASESNNVIGFAQATEIRVQIDKGLNVKLLGPLPKGVEIVTTYQSAMLSGASGDMLAGDFLAFIASDEGKRICREAGVD